MKPAPVNVPVVSIIIPTHNHAALIGEALNSVFAQTYRDYEIIVVDDDSTDDTASVLQPLIKKGLIRYIHQQKQGVSAARNRGITEAHGQYIAFLDSDDLFEPEKLEVQVKYLQDHSEIGLVHSGFTKFDNSGRDLGYRDLSWFSGNIYPQMLLYWTTLMAVDAVIIPKKVLDDVGYFNTTLTMGEDLDLYRRIARKYLFGYINRSLARIRVHAGNTSGDKLKATRGLSMYLEQAFEDDPGLSPQFRRRAYSKMYSTMAYNLLSENGREALQAARVNARSAIACDPMNLHGYTALASTLLGHSFRQALIHRWRSLRSLLMSRNRSA
jgi:glycosyltransferase involved in cell wall biosynthesis